LAAVSGLGWAAVAALVAWVVGRVATDRWFWSQWLWWMPTPAAVLAAALGLATSLRPASNRTRRRRLAGWSVALVSLLVHFATIEHRLLRPAQPMSSAGDSLRLVHWNVTMAPSGQDLVRVADAVVALDGDITVLTSPAWVPWHPPLIEQLNRGKQPVRIGPLTVVSRLPIVKVRQPLVAVDGAFIALVEIDASEKLGRPLVLYVVDMPSGPKVPRMALARKLRSLLDDPAHFGGSTPPPPDAVIGDFNITRGSASLQALFPGMRHAFDESGHRYGATFPRRLRFWHLDHVLLGGTLRAERYDLVDPGMSRHRAQIVQLENVSP
jgi:hypothetical protein